MGFGQAISTCFSKYATFSGRAARGEYWWWVLFTILAGVVAGIIGGLLDMVAGTHTITGGLQGLLDLALLLPSLAVTVRRLHDRDKSGWWWFLWLIPVIGTIILLVWFCTRGTAGENRFGPDPLETA